MSSLMSDSEAALSYISVFAGVFYILSVSSLLHGSAFLAVLRYTGNDKQMVGRAAQCRPRGLVFVYFRPFP